MWTTGVLLVIAATVPLTLVLERVIAAARKSYKFYYETKSLVYLDNSTVNLFYVGISLLVVITLLGRWLARTSGVAKWPFDLALAECGTALVLVLAMILSGVAVLH